MKRTRKNSGNVNRNIAGKREINDEDGVWKKDAISRSSISVDDISAGVSR